MRAREKWIKRERARERSLKNMFTCGGLTSKVSPLGGSPSAGVGEIPSWFPRCNMRHEHSLSSLTLFVSLFPVSQPDERISSVVHHDHLHIAVI